MRNTRIIAKPNVITRRGFLLGAGGLLAGAMLPAAAVGQSTRRLAYRIGPPVDHTLARGAFCIVTPGPPLWRGRVLPGHVVAFVRAPIPGSSGAIFLWGSPWVYKYSLSDETGVGVGVDNENYVAILDRRRLRVLLDTRSSL